MLRGWGEGEFKNYYSKPALKSPLWWLIGVLCLQNVFLLGLTIERLGARLDWVGTVPFAVLLGMAILPLAYFYQWRVRRIVQQTQPRNEELLTQMASVSFSLAGLTCFVILLAVVIAR